MQPPYLQRDADAVAGKGVLYRIVLALFVEQLLVFANERVVHGVKFESVVLSDGLIINLKE